MEKQVAIDEQMVKFKGKKIGFKQKMPPKPIKVGIKLWTLAGACNGCIGMFDLYKGAECGEVREHMADGSQKC